ncbi:MAG: phosphoenolpyruvate carboxylase [Chloroflexi bacterium]|nr:phosphoenolpyruvate carboxylase [Chloroflexota bacterium]MCL5275679.1 phosphoenolpyruvate carboxylase [Chloroflexota bacterium]
MNTHPPADHNLDALASQIRRLGNALGEVITTLEGPAILDMEERIRLLAKASRGGEAGATEQLRAATGQLNAGDAYEMAMAFTTYFELVNLAEENYRTNILRRRRAAHIAANGPIVRESIEAAIVELKELGVTPQQMQQLLDKLSIELVFTAHPTESKRRTVLSKLRRLATLLRSDEQQLDGESPTSLVRHSTLDAAIRREIASLWLTDRSRSVQPAVTDEVRTGLWYFDTTVWETIPRLQEDLEQALAACYPGLRAPTRWLTFGSWIGGDRDGNPNVTVQVTAETLQLHRRLALDKLSEATHEWSRRLSISRRRDTIAPEIDGLINAYQQGSSHVRALVNRYPNEPYRAVMAGLSGQLTDARQETISRPLYPFYSTPSLALSPTLSLPLPVAPVPSAANVSTTLDIITDSMRQGRSAVLIDGELSSLRRQLDVFGLHVARLDLRQHSAWHERAVAEVLAQLKLSGAYEQLDEAAKVAVLDEALAQPSRSVLDRIGSLSDETRNVLEPLMLAREAARRYSTEVMGVYVISMTDDLSDVLEALLMMRWCRANLDIVPLFETLQDLDNAPVILKAIFDHPHYKEHLQSHGMRQMVMLGYSDSNKDCGYVTANWALFKAQESIVRVCEESAVDLTLFHGRGGTIARGGGPAAKAILAQPLGVRSGHIRITEQGEVLSTRYHDVDIAHRTLEQVAYGVLLAAHTAQQQASVPATWRDAMERMANAGYATYKALVHDDPDFIPFWQAATPIAEIGGLKFGSRPAYRRRTRTVSDLRAIPWVFSWTQSRFVLPGWFGLGSALDDMIGDARSGGCDLLAEMYRNWPFFQTMIDNAQQSLTKADMDIAELYASLVEDEAVRTRIFSVIKAEFEQTCQAILCITGQSQLLDNEPVLQRSIQLRNPYVDPLNYIQVEMLQRLRRQEEIRDQRLEIGDQGLVTGDDLDMLRAVIELTINGVSSGLRNTG